MKNKRVHPIEWGDLSTQSDLTNIQFIHVHECDADARNNDLCRFNWDAHKLDVTGKCDCQPRLDMSDVRAKDHQIVFIVHRGKC